MPTIASLSTIYSPSGRGKDALARFLEGSPVARSFEQFGAWDREDFTFFWEPLRETSTAPARAIGASYTPENRTPRDKVTQTQRIHGDATEMDIAHLADANSGGSDIMIADRVGEKVAVYAESWESDIFNATGEDNTYYGLKTILDGETELPGYPGVFRVKDAASVSSVSGAKSLDVSTAAGQKALFELIRKELKDVRNPTCIYMNPSLAGRLETGGYETGRLSGNITDLFGKPIRTFDGVPIIETLDTTILLDEPDNTPTTALENTTSLYVVGFVPKRMSIATNSGFYYTDYDHAQAKEKGKEMWEIRAAWKIREPKRIKRIRNIKL